MNKPFIDDILEALGPKYEGVPSEIVWDVLWSWTCHPFGSKEQVLVQLKEYSENPKLVEERFLKQEKEFLEK